MRINKASDDAAGLSITMGLNLDTRVYSQAIRNVNDGISLLSVADGALGSLSGITQRQMELATQAANGSYSLTQRKAMDTEANTLVDEYNRIVATTKFNGIGIFDGTLANGLQIQSGYGSSGSVTHSIGDQLNRAIGTGTYQTATEYTDGTTLNPISLKAEDVNGDGKQDLISMDRNGNTFSAYIGNGDGTFLARVSYATGGGGSAGIVIADVNGDQKLDVLNTISGSLRVSLGNGDGSFKVSVSYASSANSQELTMGDLNHDGIQDIVVGDKNGFLTVYVGNSNGSYRAATTYTIGNNANIRESISLGDLNNDGNLDLVSNDANDHTISILFGNGNGSFSSRLTLSIPAPNTTTGSIKAIDVNHDGIADIIASNSNAMLIYQGNGDGTFNAAKSYKADGGTSNDFVYADLNGDGVGDIAESGVNGFSLYSVLLGNSDGSFAAASTHEAFQTGNAITAADLNGDGVLDIAVTDQTNSAISISIANARNVSSIGRLDLLSQSNARSALDILQTTFNRIQLEQGLVGANLSRMNSTVSTLQTSRLGTQDAYSKIMDVDVASATSDLTKNSILQQAAAAVLAQANQGPSLALRLLSS